MLDTQPDTGLPETHKQYTDKYFLKSRQILESADINPHVAIKVFARGTGPVPRESLDAAVDVIETYTDDFAADGGGVWVTEEQEFDTKDPLMVIEGPVQDVIELETMYLGVLSHHLTEAHPDHDLPTPDEFGENVAAAVNVYKEAQRANGTTGMPLLYFGARHYHPLMDKELAGAALDAGAVQTSTDIGSSNIGLEGTGTTPHILALSIASEHGKDDATRKMAEMYDMHIEDEVGTTLVDTFNQEIDDALAVCAYFDETYGDGNWHHNFRVDTCGENVAQGAEEYDMSMFDDVELGEYGTGTGVRVAGVAALRDALIEHGYGDNTDVFLSSGMGNREKAEAFVNAQNAYVKETGYDLFAGVGAGAFLDGVHGTADIYATDGEPMYKTGRAVDLNEMETYKHEHMEQVL